MKEWIIKVNDVIVFIPFGLLAVFSASISLTGNLLAGMLTFGIGFVILSILTGFWIVLSQAICEAKKQTAILEQILKEQMKSPLDRL